MLVITPQTKIGEMLEVYPHLENVLIEISPSFSKLKNPILRKTVARVASIAQAAIVGGVKVEEMVNRLRKECGQSNYSTEGENAYLSNTEIEPWFNESKIVNRFDAKPIITLGDSPMAKILSETQKLKSGEIMELKTPFIPAPIIDILKNKGFECFSVQKESDFFSYFYKK